jgi:hypothetical protein
MHGRFVSQFGGAGENGNNCRRTNQLMTGNKKEEGKNRSKTNQIERVSNWHRTFQVPFGVPFLNQKKKTGT